MTTFLGVCGWFDLSRNPKAEYILTGTLSGNRVMVTSTAPLKDIRVYTISGALVKQAKGGFCSHELYLPEDGIYVISAKSANGATQTAKVAVN